MCARVCTSLCGVEDTVTELVHLTPFAPVKKMYKPQGGAVTFKDYLSESIKLVGKDPDMQVRSQSHFSACVFSSEIFLTLNCSLKQYTTAAHKGLRYFKANSSGASQSL